MARERYHPARALFGRRRKGMNRRMVSIEIARRAALMAFAAVASSPVLPAAATTRVVLVSKLVIDAGSGRTLFEAAAKRVRPPASLTKMMTLLLAFEAIDSGRLHLDDPLTMTRNGAGQPPSRLGLAAGHTMSVRDAIRVIAVISANDVAVALAERLAGSETAFVARMNRRAARLGMTGTCFGNATGLAPNGGTSTARDMALLGRRLTELPDFYRVFSRRMIRWGGRLRPNHNRLLGKVPGVDGLKTGYTVPAGFNLAASAQRGGRRIIVVVLGARSAGARDLLVANLLERGFSSPARPATRVTGRKRVARPG